MELFKGLGSVLFISDLRMRDRLVRPGGILVYSTCSIDPEENEERISSFLLRHPVWLFFKFNFS